MDVLNSLGKTVTGDLGKALTFAGTAATSGLGKAVVGTLAQALIPVVASAIQKFIYFGATPQTPGGQAVAQAAAAIVGSLSTYISSIFKGVSPQVAKRASDAIAKSVGNVARKARAAVDKNPGLSEDQKVSEALNIAVSALADIARQAMQGQSPVVITEVADDMRDSMNALSSFPSPFIVDEDAHQQEGHSDGSGEIKYGGRSIMHGRKMNADWILGDTISGGEELNVEPDYSEFLGNQTNMEAGFNSIPNITSATTTTTDAATQTATDALKNLASGRSLTQSILWATLPFLVSPALKLAGFLGKKAMSGISYFFPSFTPTQKKIERYFKDPSVQHTANIIGQIAVSGADAYYRDRARQQAAEAIYNRQKAEVERQNNLTEAENKRRTEQANDDFADLYKKIQAENLGRKNATDRENEKAKLLNDEKRNRYNADLDSYKIAEEADQISKLSKFRKYAYSLGPKFDDFYAKHISGGPSTFEKEDAYEGAKRAIEEMKNNPKMGKFREFFEKFDQRKVADDMIEAEKDRRIAQSSYIQNEIEYTNPDYQQKVRQKVAEDLDSTIKKAIASRIDQAARESLSDLDYMKFFYNWQKNNLPFADPVTAYSGTKPTEPKYLDEHVKPDFLPLPSHAKRVELKPLQPMPMQNSQMYETPYMNQVVERFTPYIAANLQQSLAAAQKAAQDPFSSLDLSNLPSLSGDYVQNPLSTNTFVTSGVTGKSTPLNTIRVPAYMPTSLTSVKPLDFNANQNLFSSTADAVETLNTVEEKKKKKDKKSKEGKYGTFEGPLPLHMTEESSLFQDTYNPRGYQPPKKKIRMEQVQPLNIGSNYKWGIPLSAFSIPKQTHTRKTRAKRR